MKRMKRTEAGMGGKLGHRNQSHWAKTEFVKEEARRVRRHMDRIAVKEGRDE